MKIVIFGYGHVGKAYATYLKKEHDVFVVDPKYGKKLKETNFDLALICVDTPFDKNINSLSTDDVEASINELLGVLPNIDIVIKSTLPIGACDGIIAKFKKQNIIYSPEFLREKTAVSDIEHPYRVIIGCADKKLSCVRKYISLFHNVDILIMKNKEAEATKLFSNAYLATRLSFFNEMDTTLSLLCIDSKKVIEGMGKDPRVGELYNTPGEGWKGKCLPKDLDAVIGIANSYGLTLFDEVKRSNERRKEKFSK